MFTDSSSFPLYLALSKNLVRWLMYNYLTKTIFFLPVDYTSNNFLLWLFIKKLTVRSNSLIPLRFLGSFFKLYTLYTFSIPPNQIPAQDYLILNSIGSHTEVPQAPSVTSTFTFSPLDGMYQFIQ